MFNKCGKVLLIIHDVYQDDNPFPLGPAYLASSLKQYGAEVEAYCMDLFHYTNDELAEKLKDASYDLIGVGFLAARYRETVVDLCSVINANKKDAWLVLGGHGPSPVPEYVLKETKADIVVIGEGERTIVELLDCKLNQGNLRNVDGIAYRFGDRVNINKRRKLITDLDEIPIPAWEVFPMEEYANSIKWFGQAEGEKSLAFTHGRGCINRCNFCYRLEKGLRRRSIENVIKELKILVHHYHINNYIINDEMFLLNKRELFAFEEALLKNNLEIKFGCDARVDMIDEETVRCLKRIGCQFLCIGFESTNDNVLKLMKKNTTVEQNIRALDVITEVGDIPVALNFIWNNLGDTEETLRDNASMIKKYNMYSQIRTIRSVTAYPGSDLYYRAIEMGLLKGPGDFFDKFVNSDLITVNFMDIPLERCYELLLEINSDLIIDHFEKTNGNMTEAQKIINGFIDLYNNKTRSFRGVRHYAKKKTNAKLDR